MEAKLERNNDRADLGLLAAVRSPRGRHVLFAIALLVALFLYTVHLTSDLYGDEQGHTYKVIAEGDLWSNIRDPGMCHPPLYFMLAKLSYEITGKSWGMRIPSIIFAIGTVILVSFAARKILGERFFLLAAWLAAFSPFLLEFSAEGRAYAMLMFFSVAMVWAFVTFLQTENTRNMLILAGISICGALTHYFFLFQLAFLGIYYLIARRRMSRYAWGILGIVASILLPFVYILFLEQNAQFTEHLQVSWFKEYFSVFNFVARLAVALTVGYNTFRLQNMDPARNFTFQILRDNWILVLLTLATFGGIVYAWVRLALARKKWFWLLTFGILIPVGLGLLGAASGFYLIREKHLAAVWVCYFLILLLALDYLARTKVGWLVIPCYAVVVFMSIFHYAIYPNEYSRRMDWTGLNRTLEREMSDSDCLLSYIDNLQYLSLGKMKVLDRDVKRISLRTDRPPDMSLSRFADQIDKSVDGTVFIVNNETDRHIVDPSSEVTRTLKTSRRVSEHRFGRNLILHMFKPKMPEPHSTGNYEGKIP